MGQSVSDTCGNFKLDPQAQAVAAGRLTEAALSTNQCHGPLRVLHSALGGRSRCRSTVTVTASRVIRSTSGSLPLSDLKVDVASADFALPVQVVAVPPFCFQCAGSFAGLLGLMPAGANW